MNGKTMLYIDQWGNRFWARTVGELRLLVAGSPGSWRTMYRDKKDGTTVRCGVIINGHWLDRFAPVELPA